MDASRLSRPRARLLTLAAAAFLAITLVSPATLVQAGPAPPTVTRNTFDFAPRKLSYFQDSPVVLYHDASRNIFRSPDEGKTWAQIKGVPEDIATELIMHAFDPKTAYILTMEKKQYKTSDLGETWTAFETDLPPIAESHVLSFHATRPNWVLIAGTACDDRRRCHDETYYTQDGFATRPKKLLARTHKCEWAVSSLRFDEAPTQLIHCLEYRARDDGETTLDDVRMVKSGDFFETKETVAFGSTDRSAIVNFVTKETFMLAAEKHLDTGDMSLYVSEDAKVWAKANFPHLSNIREDSYTILESTPYSLIVDVKASPDDRFGSLMLSNSNGTYFVRSKANTNRNTDDTVDFEKIQNIDGVYIVNLVDNHDRAPRSEDEKRIRTQISFEAGATWQYITPPEAGPNGRRHDCNPNSDGSCSLHLHSVTSAKVAPPVFSSKAAPGVVMGVGNVGPYLLPWEDCDTYLSEDGGLTWKAALEHPHKYEFGDMGGLIVAVRDDNVAVAYFEYSSDRGQSWHRVDLEDNIRPGALVSDPESTSQKFMLFVRGGNKYYSYQLDLSGIYDRKCERNDNNADRSDFEKWYARNLRNNPDCLMGVKTWYWRRKAGAECMVQESFKDPFMEEEICACTDEDFECDYNFVLKNGECVLDGKELMPEGECKKEGDTYLGSSGYRLVPGNKCDLEKGIKKNELKTKTCTAQAIPTDIKHSVTKFGSRMAGGFQYFLKSSVVMFLTESKEAWRSTDDGSTWNRVLSEAGKFHGLFIHDEQEKVVYLFTNDALFISHNRGETFDRRELPAPPNQMRYPLIDFHPDSDKGDWLLYLGQKEGECFTRLYRTQDGGRNWKEVDTWVDKAVYAEHRNYEMPDRGIFSLSWKKPMPAGVCQEEVQSTEANPLQMVYMLDADASRLVLFDNAVQFYVVETFLAVAEEVNGNFMLHVSLNGHDFAPATFPPNMRVDKNGFTVLQSTTGSLVVDVAKSNVVGREHGRLFKSNSNGTFFSLQLEDTNRNELQLVDWEKIGGIEGVILVNQVTNTKSLARDGEKHIQTMVSFNDGSSWNPIKAPTGSDCSDGDDCHLHLHSVTDYNGPGAVFSASSSVGLVMGVGNVGKHLLPLASCQTYLSRDAGRTWRRVSDSQSLYEFGDEGGVLVLVDPTKPTQEVSFSYDFGSTWNKATFADSAVLISSLTTEPTSHTSKITVTGVLVNGDQESVIATLDFSDRRECVMDKGNTEKSDFEKWSPFEGEDDRCILGREITYWRRKPDRACRVNDKDGEPDQEQAVCKCTERDFECDIGFFRDEVGACQRFDYDPEKPKKCDGTYMAKSGFRKIAASVCKDGKDLENQKVERLCGSAKGIQSKKSAFDSKYKDDSFFYFPDSDIAMMRTEANVYISHNDGKDWDEVDVDGAVLAIQRHPYDKTRAIISTTGGKQYLTQDRGLNWDVLDMPVKPAVTFTQYFWSFHPTEPEWMIFLGEVGCDDERSNRCHAEAHFTRDSGKIWQPLADWVKSCAWAQEPKFKRVNIQGIYCEQYADKSVSQRSNPNPATRFVYTDRFMQSSTVLFESIVGYATYSEYLVVAEFIPRQNELRVSVSQDGTNFELARYPSNFGVVNPAYTILDSTTRSVFMAITTSDQTGYKYGNLFTSDSNGTYFSLSKKYINQGDRGNVDFEKMQGIDGVALMNEVINPNEANQRITKKLRSLLTIDNGNTWSPLSAPESDSDGKRYKDCTGTDCSLHLHNYLDRKHVDDLFSSSSIPGMVIGVGNVGTSLDDYEDGNTFITRNGGYSWKEIIKGPYQYDFGDQGSIILFVKDDGAPTDHILYSLDHGNTVQQFEFATEKVIVQDIIAKPSGIGKSFVLLAVPQARGGGAAKHLIYQIDFEGLNLPRCRLDLNDEKNDDFERWSIADLQGEKCMFGRQVEYFRRIEDRQCFVGEIEINPRHIDSNCQCTANDFECDFNYEPDGAGNCVLIKDATPVAVNEKEVCANLPAGQDYYYESKGYRKMAFSSCVGDHERFGTKKICPGRGGMGFFSWVAILGASGGMAYGLLLLMGRYKGYLGGRGGSFIRLGNDVYDQIHLPRSSSLPTVNMPRSFSRSFSRVRVPDFVYQVWDKIALPVMPTRFGNYFNRVRYQNLSQEPGEVIMDDYFDHYLDDDDEDGRVGAGGGDSLVGHGDGLQDAQERYRDDSDESEGEEDLDNMV